MVEKEANAQTYQLRDVGSAVPSSSNSSDDSTNLGNTNSKLNAWQLCVTILDLVNHAMIISVTVYLLYYSARSLGVMDLHVTLCTLGYVLLMSEAIVVLANDSKLTKFLTRKAKSHVHWVLQLLGLACIVAGFVVMYRVKKVHFRSIHAILGFSSFVITIVLVALGYPVFVAAKLHRIIRPVVIKFCHNFLGIASFALGMASQCYGYKKGWLPIASATPNIQMILTVITGLITVLSLRGSLPSLCRQFVSLFR